MEHAGAVEARRLAASLGQDLRRARSSRGLTQRRLGDRVGLSQARISQIESGFGGSLPLASWVTLGIAVGRPLAVGLSRPPATGPADAGHLDIQEFILSLPIAGGQTRHVELPTRATDPSRSIDVCLRDVASGRILILEAWNRIDDLGAAIRSTNRKLAEADGLAAATGPDVAPPLAARGVPPRASRKPATGPDRPIAVAVHACWIVRVTAANRRLAQRYPGILRAAFPASSAAWVRALTTGSQPPSESGFVWFDSA
jgi:DNA-binding XRE family transcriptional regulator